MKVLPILLSVFLVGCAATKESSTPHVATSLNEMKQQCINERSQMIKAEWRRFEFETWGHVENGWRRNNRQWAALECKYGQYISQFHPAGMDERHSILKK